MHLLQTLIVALLVLSCGAYAGWSLMPAAARRWLAAAALRAHPPESLARRLRRAATVSSGCGCDGCDAGAKAPGARRPSASAPASMTTSATGSATGSATPSAAHPIVFHRRPPR